MFPAILSRLCRNENVLSIALTFFLLSTFWFSPVKQLADSNYSMLLTQSLLEHGTFALDQYAVPKLEPNRQQYYISDGNIYQLEWNNGHLFYYLPPGSSVLSLPYVAIMNLFGRKVTNPDSTYNEDKEIRIESGLAALLVAIFGAIVFRTARLILPIGWSLIVSLGAALGTQAWSTASRAMWSETWGIVLLSLAVYLLLAQAAGKRKLNAVLLATLMSWSYFVRPTNAVHIAAITYYMLCVHLE